MRCNVPSEFVAFIQLIFYAFATVINFTENCFWNGLFDLFVGQIGIQKLEIVDNG